jgi:hypothetical protein
MPILLKIVGKLDITPVIERLKGVDIFEDSDSAEERLNSSQKKKSVSSARKFSRILRHSSEKLRTTSRRLWRLIKA